METKVIFLFSTKTKQITFIFGLGRIKHLYSFSTKLKQAGTKQYKTVWNFTI
jgi:hypothetical protein